MHETKLEQGQEMTITYPIEIDVERLYQKYGNSKLKITVPITIGYSKERDES